VFHCTNFLCSELRENCNRSPYRSRRGCNNNEPVCFLIWEPKAGGVGFGPGRSLRPDDSRFCPQTSNSAALYKSLFVNCIHGNKLLLRPANFLDICQKWRNSLQDDTVYSTISFDTVCSTNRVRGEETMVIKRFYPLRRIKNGIRTQDSSRNCFDNQSAP
jgi:hypothetical protein